MALNGTVAYVNEAPVCDICKYTGTDSERQAPAVATHDVKTKDGRWAFVCNNHYITHAMYDDLGTGKGQKLEVRPDIVSPVRHTPGKLN